MKKLFALLLAAALVMSLPAGAAASGGDPVTEAYHYVYNSGDGDVWEYHIPHVEGTGAGIEAVNAAIWDDLYNGCVAQIEYGGTGYWPSVIGMSYHWAVNGDVLSLWVRLHGITDNDDYYVYNISRSTGERISDAELFKAAGVSRERFNDLLRTALAQRLDAFPSTAGMEDFMREMRQDALSDQNLALAMPYMGMGGSLCTVAWVYVPAGAGQYLETLTLIPGDMESQLVNFIEHSDTQYFSENDLEGFTEEMCNYARNGVYARSGRGFKDQGLLNYFLQFDWYSPDISPDQFTEAYLNDCQIKNIALVLAYEQAHGY